MSWPACGEANRRLKLAELEGIYEDVEREMQDDSLTPAARTKYHNLNSKLIHDMNEMCGHLQVRTTVEVESDPTAPRVWVCRIVEKIPAPRGSQRRSRGQTTR
jgi:hypothetical protein